MKLVVFSFDDGTIHDYKLVDLMNIHHIRGTFNLNSGLGNFIWNCEGKDIFRPEVETMVSLYEGHEICSHSLTHPHLDWEDDERLYNEIYKDKENLERIFKRKIKGFATPFDTYNEHVISVIREAGFEYCRLPDVSRDYLHQGEDKFHLHINALTSEDDLFKEIDDFINDENESGLMIIAGHSYEFCVNDSWDYIENVFAYVENNPSLKSVTTSEAIKELYHE